MSRAARAIDRLGKSRTRGEIGEEKRSLPRVLPFLPFRFPRRVENPFGSRPEIFPHIRGELDVRVDDVSTDGMLGELHPDDRLVHLGLRVETRSLMPKSCLNARGKLPNPCG